MYYTLMRLSILTGCCSVCRGGETGECAEASELAGRDAPLAGDTPCSPAIPPSLSAHHFRQARGRLSASRFPRPGRSRHWCVAQPHRSQ